MSRRKRVRIRRYLTAAATEQVIHTFVTSRLDVGNALKYQLPLMQIQLLQKVQNWADRLIDDAMKYSHGADEMALAADNSASVIEDPATHSSSTDWPCTWIH